MLLLTFISKFYFYWSSWYAFFMQKHFYIPVYCFKAKVKYTNIKTIFGFVFVADIQKMKSIILIILTYSFYWNIYIICLKGYTFASNITHLILYIWSKWSERRFFFLETKHFLFSIDVLHYPFLCISLARSVIFICIHL